MINLVEQGAQIGQDFSIREPKRSFAFIIGPEGKNQNALKQGLPNNGIDVRVFADLEDAKQALLEKESPDIIVANELALPSVKSLTDFCIPFIVTGETDQESDENQPSRTAQILNSGADFYINRNSSPESVAAHIRASLRRGEAQSDKDSVNIGSLTYDMKVGRFVKDGKEVPLTETEHIVANFLVRNRGKIISSKDILRNCWGEAFIDDKNYLRVCISRLRTVLEELGEYDLIKTVHSFGYFIPNPDSMSADEYEAGAEVINYPEEVSETHSDDKRIKVLVVARDYSSLNYMSVGLPNEHFKVATVDDPKEAERILQDRQDFVLVEEGFTINPNSKGNTAKYITMIQNECNTAAALDAGAFSAVKKFEDIEKLAALMTRGQFTEVKIEKQSSIFCAEGIVIDPIKRAVTRDGKEVSLSGMEWRLMMYMALNPNVIIPREDMLVRIWGPEYFSDYQYLRVLVDRIRKKVGVPGLIKTVHGRGYMLKSNNKI